MAFGITDAGFQKKRIADIKPEIEDVLRNTFGNQINLTPQSVFGQLVGILAEREGLIWDAMQDVYNSQYPDTAFGVSLDNVAALSGITRQGAIRSTQEGYRLFGAAATLVPAGTQFSVDGSPDTIFETDADVTLVAGQDEVQDISFDAVPDAGTWRLNFRGTDTTDLAFDDDAAAVQAALNALPFGDGITVAGDYTTGFTVTFAGDAGKQEQPLIVVDDNTLTSGGPAVTITITETTPGVNQGVANLTQTTASFDDVGPGVAPAGTLTEIVTPVGGLNRGINVSDADVGREIETDNELRARRATTLQVAGAGTVEAIRSRLLDLEGVTTALVFENDTNATDGEGRPAKSFEAVVQGGDDQAVADLLWEVKPAGIETFGSITLAVEDSLGNNQDVSFSRPTEVPIYIEVDLTTNLNFPANGIATAQAALVERGSEAFGIGDNVIVYPKLICALDSIAGITDIAIRVGTASSPTLDDNISIDPDEIATFDSARTQVVVL